MRTIPTTLLEQFGQIDIYLFDQLLRGRLTAGSRVLAAGSGEGRNLPYLFQNGFDVHAIERDPVKLASVRRMAAELAPALPASNFRAEPIEALSFGDDGFEAVLCLAVLHFAANSGGFESMIDQLVRVLAPGGLLFTRLASTIGLESAVEPLDVERRYHLPDGSDRFLVDADYLSELETRHGLERIDPLKTTVVDGQRSMTTWVTRLAG